MKPLHWFRHQSADKKRNIADGVLTTITIIWAMGFIFIKDAMTGIGPFWLMADRHIMAVALLVFIFHKRLKRNFAQLWKISALVGFFWWGGLFALTYGLKYTTASNAAFLSGLGVILTPFAGKVWGLPNPRRAAWFGIALATLGLALLACHDNGWSFNYGDWFCLLCAVVISFQYASVSHYAPRGDAISLAVLQIGWAAIYSVVVAVLFEPFHGFDLSLRVWGDIAGAGLICTALMLVIQCMTQKYTTAVHTAIIFSIEPAIGGILAWWIFGDPLGGMQWLGCGCIISGMIYSELGS